MGTSCHAGSRLSFKELREWQGHSCLQRHHPKKDEKKKMSEKRPRVSFLSHFLVSCQCPPLAEPGKGAEEYSLRLSTPALQSRVETGFR